MLWTPPAHANDAERKVKVAAAAAYARQFEELSAESGARVPGITPLSASLLEESWLCFLTRWLDAEETSNSDTLQVWLEAQ